MKRLSFLFIIIVLLSSCTSAPPMRPIQPMDFDPLAEDYVLLGAEDLSEREASYIMFDNVTNSQTYPLAINGYYLSEAISGDLVRFMGMEYPKRDSFIKMTPGDHTFDLFIVMTDGYVSNNINASPTFNLEPGKAYVIRGDRDNIDKITYQNILSIEITSWEIDIQEPTVERIELLLTSE